METLPRFFIELTLRGLALLVVAGVAALALRKAQPAVRHAVWTAAVAGMLLLPLLQTGTPGWTFPVWIERAANVPQSLDVTDPQVVNVTATVPSGPRNAPSRPVNAHVIMLAIYLAGASALLIRQAWSSVTLRRLLKRSRAVDLDGLASAAEAVGFTGRLPEVRESDEVRVPFTYGVSAPVIVLPNDWREWSAPKRLAVLAHETAHVARRDWLIGRIAAVNRAMNWWNPAAWWLERHLAALAEEAVDEAALAAVGDVKHYASAVVDFAIAMQGQRLGSMEATAMARSTKVGRRVERILASRGAGAAGLKRGVFLTVAAWAAPLILVAASALPEVRRVGALESLTAAIQAPAGPTVTQQLAAVRPAETPAVQPQARQEAVGQDRESEAAQRFKLMNESRSAGDLQKAREQAWWLIENCPDRGEAVTASMLMVFPGPGGGDEAERQSVREAWKKQAAKNGQNGAVLLNAARIATRFDSRFEAEDLIIRARKVLEPGNSIGLTHLASLYISAIPLPGRTVSSSPEAASFQAKAMNELETTTDAQLVGLVGEMLIAGHATISASQDAQAEAALRDRLRKINQMAAHYLARAQSIEPEIPRWQASLKRATEEPQVTRVPDPTPGVKRITVGGAVQRAKVLKTVQPEYPPLAKQARIQGTVRFSVVIGSDGTIKNLTLLGGHPLLVQAARDAVQQWVYNPTLLNGEPVEVVTQIDVNFTLAEDSTMTGATGEVHMIGGGVSAPVPIYKVEPAYPPGLPADSKDGRVLLGIVINGDGNVATAEPVSGDPAFFEAALEAVRQWKFKPGMKDGQPVSVKANVEVNFRRK